MTKKASKAKKILISDDESIIELDVTEKSVSSKRSSVEVDSDYSSKASSGLPVNHLNKRKLITYDEEVIESKRNKSKKVIKESENEFSDIHESMSDEGYEPKSSKKKPKRSSKRIAKKSYAEDEDEDEDEDEEEEEDEEDDDYKPKKKNRKTKEPKSERPIRKKNKATSKRDDWNDDESHDSDSSCEIESDDNLKEPNQKKIQFNKEDLLSFFNNESIENIQSTITITDDKVKKLVSLRPFDDLNDLYEKLKKNALSYTLTSARQSLEARCVVNNLFDKCKFLSQRISKYVEKITDPNLTDEKAIKLAVKKQPKILNSKMKLKPYQLTGLNWLCYMYEENLNAVLADEMGLGKTCQTIAFLAYLHEMNERLTHLIVVPSSTLENWSREISNWFPAFNFVIYNGSQEERREIRRDVLSWKKKKSGPPLNAILTTYSFVSINEHDKSFLRSIKFEYCIFDEAHCFKNMKTLKYKSLMKIRSKRKLLLTGTPLQNNIVELMSLLYFVTPNTFLNKQDYFNRNFLPRNGLKESDAFYNEKIVRARGIMEPFVLRRLKVDVLKDLPNKTDEILVCKMTQSQEEQYKNLLEFYKQRKRDMLNENKRKGGLLDALIELRKVSNHPLLVRNLYTNDKIREMAHHIIKESDADTNYDYVVEDMSFMNDFELHKLCSLYKGLKGYELTDDHIFNSGKFKKLKELLEEFKEAGDQVLIFSQFKIVLDIIEDFFGLLKIKFLRLDGSTKVDERQGLIDKFNNDKSILAFMLTTKAGGVGINLTGANRVVIYDIDYNPHNDKQAEARSHRVGQKKEVQTYKLISRNTIDETMLEMQAKKLELDADIHGINDESKQKMQIFAMLKEILN